MFIEEIEIGSWFNIKGSPEHSFPIFLLKKFSFGKNFIT